MRDGIFIVDGDGHVMDFAHRCYQKYLPEQYRRRIAFFPGAQWDRRQAPNGDLGRDPDTPQEMLADLGAGGDRSRVPLSHLGATASARSAKRTIRPHCAVPTTTSWPTGARPLRIG